MSDFVAALGLVLVLEGLILAAFPIAAKQAMAGVLATPENTLRAIGVISAVFGLVIVWLIRG
jgi:uncharacterized protein YjeT (DUF2065 family)